jgi:enoyl-CoA hydratase/carnithine racemase
MDQTDAGQDADILLRHDVDGVATLTLNRPDQFNGLSEALLARLQAEIDAISRDRSIRVVVIAANGKAFCAGHDLKEMRANPSQDYYERLFKTCSRMMTSLIKLPQPVIARVHGLATAAGCQLVATCDLAVASAEARFGVSGINVGLFCMTPGVALSRNIERKKSFEMLFTGDFITPDDALASGLVNRVVAPGELDAAITEIAGKIIAKSQAAVEAGKEVFYRQLEMGLSEAYDYASLRMARNMMFHDAGEGIDAFIGKRKPTWKHE